MRTQQSVFCRRLAAGVGVAAWVCCSSVFAASIIGTVDGGGSRATSASYTIDGSIGGIGGISTAGNDTVRHGYIAQLTEVSCVTITGIPAQVNETSTTQLSGSALLDDATVTVLTGSDLLWSIPTWPIQDINISGVASAAVVYANTLGTANGRYLGVLGIGSLLVLDTIPDNYGSYAGDGIPDSWQNQYFGLNNPNAAPSADPDIDGFTNQQEYQAGTDPTDPLSHPVTYTWSADALRARTDGKQQLLWRHLTNAVPDGQVSLWTLGTNANLQAATSCGPFPSWTAADMLVSRQANTPHLVWTNTSGAISIWNFNSSGAFMSAQTHGPFTGWTYSTAAISPTNNDQWMLWKHTAGQVSLWRLNSNSVYQASTTMGPFTGWSAEELAISPVDGKVRVLWKHTDGSVSLWRFSSTGSYEAANNYGPFTGWTAQTLTLGPSDNKVRILWENTSGAIAVWRLTTTDGYEASTTFGPFSGWLTLGMTMRPDNKLQLPWDRTADHAFSLWRLNDTEGFEAAPSYGPYSGWQVFGGDVDGANKSHLLWRKTDGAISLWRLSPTGTLENSANFGPY